MLRSLSSYFLDVSVKDWRRKLLQMAAESIKANYESNKDGNEESNDKIDTEVKLLMQRQDWLDGMKKVSESSLFPYFENSKTYEMTPNCNDSKLN